MRYPPHHKPLIRDRIVAAASRSFRARGLSGTAVAAVMADAGLTHGGFYAHFPDKDALAAEACRRALAEAWRSFEREAGRAPDAARERLIARYLSTEHRDRPADGCVLAALGPELARSSPAVREELGRAIEAQLEKLAAAMPGRTARQRRDEAGVLISTLLGAIVFSRLLPDRAGRRHLRATKAVVHRAWPAAPASTHRATARSRSQGS